MSMAVSGVLSNYTYGSGSYVRPKLDKDNDGHWSSSEVGNYAKAYEKATGNKIDVDKLMSTYDADNDGKLNFREQESVYKDDALNLKSLSQPNSGVSSSGASISETLADMMATMSTTSKMALSRMVFQSEQNSNLLSMFSAGNSMFDFTSVMNYNSNKYTSAFSNVSSQLGQMMNIFV
ncbi:MAG: EF-hand domain-containing protein [Oscillospiraceae bacterium]|nr:EF-hand domain-containing protein [Oscillospiraceae bacterium]